MPAASSLGLDYLTPVRPGLVPAAGQLRPLAGAGGWAANAGFDPLLPLWSTGELAFVPAVSNPGITRSHFQAQRWLVSGGAQTASTGWMDRLLTAIGPGTTFRAVTAGGTAPAAYLGNEQNLVFDALRDFKIPAWSGYEDRTATAIAGLYRGLSGSLPQDVATVMSAVGTAGVAQATAGAQNGAVYAADDQFGAALADLATLLRAEVGLQLATVDVGGWDTHTDEATDLDGHGSVMWLLGGGLTAAQVAGAWRPLTASALDQGDVPALNQAFDVLSSRRSGSAPGRCRRSSPASPPSRWASRTPEPPVTSAVRPPTGRGPRVTHYDVLVVGSGFGGSVTALRLAEKGYRVGVLEAGRRFTPETLPKTSWDVRNFLWAPHLGCTGIQRIHLLKDVVILAGAGVGGGSLNYANTLYEPGSTFFDDPQWRHITDWRSELSPHYAQARRMLGVVTNPTVTPADVEMQKLAGQFGRQHTFTPTDVGVFFGRDGQEEPGRTVPDPYFGGAGPSRTGCIQCGECMTGCRHGAKNTLDLNYLALAESAGAVVHPLTTVSDVAPRNGFGYTVQTVPTGRFRRGRTFTADDVVFAAGTYGTQTLLHKLRASGSLPNVSPRLGELTRTNSEALIGAKAHRHDVDYRSGVAITSSWYPDADTHIEPCRYGKGSNLMGLLVTALTDGGTRRQRWAQWTREGLFRSPRALIRGQSVRRWSERTIILLVMQTLNNSITVRRTRLGRLTSKQGIGEPNPTSIPAAVAAARQLADNIQGEAGGTWGELFNIPMTAHFIGGCAIGDSPATGVIDAYQRLFGHPGLHVVDGSALSANLGVNPSLSITAQAERAMSLWPNQGEADLRPPLGARYRRLEPVAPRHPVVPSTAIGALRRGPVPVTLDVSRHRPGDLAEVPSSG